MFTGIITGIGHIVDVQPLGEAPTHGKRLLIEAPEGYLDDVHLGDSIALLEDIKGHDHGLLDAIADGTFGLMKRPADGGKGLDGVARKARDYYNPATEILEDKA